MIEFSLHDLHPSYERPVRDTVRGLVSDYPIVRGLRVETYRSDGDDSMGCSPEAGLIRLNLRWFGRPIDELRDAAHTDDLVRVGGSSPPIPYHGGMEEPHHLLCHEFGHQLQFAMSGWRAFAEPHWLQSCADPVHCRPPSGYALASVDEFWADAFAALHLNYGSQLVDRMREFMDGSILTEATSET